MSSIFTSSIGKKLIMSISGAFLFLFLIFHMVMNGALVFSDEAYNTVVNFLGANWYALIGTVVLAAGVAIHFIYSIILTLQNRKARGKIRYADNKRAKGVEWTSKNMFILGAIVLIGLVLHLYNFWYNMQWPELLGEHVNSLGTSPKEGALIVRSLFSQLGYVVIYLVWIAALWMHLTHGIWSMLQTIGWNSKVWMKRIKWISYGLATILMGGFALIVITLYIQSLL